MDLYEMQRELESEATAAGFARFEKELKRARTSEAGAGKKLMREALLPAAMAMSQRPTGSGSRQQYHKWVAALGPSLVAYLTLKAMLDACDKRDKQENGVPLSHAASAVSELLRDEARLRIFEKLEPALFKHKMKGFSTSNYKHRKRSLNATIKWADIDVQDALMSRSESIQVGSQLLDLVAESTGLIEIFTIQGKIMRGGLRRSHTVVRLTEKTAEWISQRNSFLSLLNPVYLPMILPPKDWQKGQRGGYWFTQEGKHTLVRAAKKTVDVVDQADMPAVYDALNAVQATAWRINDRVLSIVGLIQKSDRAVAGIETFVKEELPARPPNIDTDEEALKDWKFAAGRVRNRNYERQLRVMDATRTIQMASKFTDVDEVFFPWSLDYRGRMYPLVSHLTPQGNDLSRALLTFAHGKPLGILGATFLARHGANCMADCPITGKNLDKESFEVRERWVEDNQANILQAALHPEAFEWWPLADKPLQFLAFCFEYAGYLREGSSYVSSLPVAQDGSCNGLQHYAALTRDLITAEAVNLVECERPADVYRLVRDEADELLVEKHSFKEDQLATQWLNSGYVTRKMVKRPVMTYPYGMTQFGMADAIKSELPGSAEDISRNKACRYLANTILAALKTTVVGAYDTMKYLRKIAEVQVKQDPLPLVWVTPLGMPVVQVAWNFIARQIKAKLSGSTMYPVIYFQGDKTQCEPSKNKLPPNYIHSLDATALMMTVNACVKQGVCDFGMVHDSYATLAADSSSMAAILRTQFYMLYSKPVLATFHSQMEEQYKGEQPLPQYPEAGEYDLRRVLQARYFFH